MNHTWLYKKILEKFSSYQEFAKAINYGDHSVYALIVAYQVPSEGMMEKMVEILDIRKEEINDYMIDDYDTNKKHRAMTGENYFTAKLVAEEEAKLAEGEAGGDGEFGFQSSEPSPESEENKFPPLQELRKGVKPTKVEKSPIRNRPTVTVRVPKESNPMPNPKKTVRHYANDQGIEMVKNLLEKIQVKYGFKRNISNSEFAVILGEEIGEVCRACQEDLTMERLKAELIDVAVTAMAFWVHLSL